MVKNFAVLPCEDISPIEKGGGISCHVSLQKKSVHPKKLEVMACLVKV